MKELVKKINYWSSEKFVGLFRNEPYIQTILLHKIYPSRKDVLPANGTISEGIDINQFEYILNYFTKRNIEFITEVDLINKNLDPKKKYIYLTFDDGYFNNNYALKILEKYNAKATFFISTNHILEEKSYWWDVQYRERKKQNKDSEYIAREVQELYKMKWQVQEEYLKKHLGEDALVPKNDLDRPMTKEELTAFSMNKHVYLGNHTHNHINTTLYSKPELIDSIKNAEQFLADITPQPIKSISYPHGIHNESVVETMKELGYKVGITVRNGKNKVIDTADSNLLLTLNRNQLSGFHDLRTQLHNINTNFSIINSIKSLLIKNS